jgi:hypothetical protein
VLSNGGKIIEKSKKNLFKKSFFFSFFNQGTDAQSSHWWQTGLS